MLPCTSVIPPPPGIPDLQNVFTTSEPAPLIVAPQLPIYEAPRFPSDFPLGNLSSLYWLATLARATYSPTSALFGQAVRAVLPASYPITFVANAAGLVPGYAIIKMPQGAIVVVSGTTNLGQWQDQIFSNALTDFVGRDGNIRKFSTAPIYNTAANAIDTALAAAVPDDQQILYVGHSMGGAVALVLHALNEDESSDRVASRCLTFAAPKPGDQRLANRCRSSAQVFRRFQLDGDFVPALPPDLGIINMAVPAPFAAVSGNWANFKAPRSPWTVSNTGVIGPAAEPFLPLLIVAATLTAAAGNPLAPVALHLMKSYADRFRGAYGAQLPTDDTFGWSDPQQIDVTNQQLDAAGL